MTDITTCEHEVNCKKTPHIMSGSLKFLWEKTKNILAKYRQHRIDREAFQSLMRLDDASLKDIGVSRQDIIWASNLALDKNASRELEKIRAQNLATARRMPGKSKNQY